MLRRLYNWTMSLSGHRHAIWALAAVAFVESSVFPIPPDILLIPMVLAARGAFLRIAMVCTVASVLGGMAGYGIGFFLFDTVGRPLLELYGYGDKFAQFKGYYDEWGAWIVAGAGLTPFPYKVITIASGVAALDPVVFISASAVSRGLRFFFEAGLLWYFGEPIRVFLERHLNKLAVLFFILLFGGFAMIKLVL